MAPGKKSYYPMKNGAQSSANVSFPTHLVCRKNIHESSPLLHLKWQKFHFVFAQNFIKLPTLN
ncbi:hypothetical protein Cabys_2984 [Caldithrix abyssi DSM 13497]|uniref:Uncharacterized protein n=1 Tax=Caldithrix abyssi DSM 13497 TaxID=880073 RepID=A0A1J1CBF6_CALAY|nr:hypothetical protein Cabys_2984 [Caldithrix abyssi DSM 13497]